MYEIIGRIQGWTAETLSSLRHTIQTRVQRALQFPGCIHSSSNISDDHQRDPKYQWIEMNWMQNWMQLAEFWEVFVCVKPHMAQILGQDFGSPNDLRNASAPRLCSFEKTKPKNDRDLEWKPRDLSETSRDHRFQNGNSWNTLQMYYLNVLIKCIIHVTEKGSQGEFTFCSCP